MNDVMNMKNDFALDLGTARQEAGFTQADCAHLMNCDATKLTRLEQGTVLPELWDICLLSLIFGRTFESLFGYVMQECRRLLGERLESIPDCSRDWGGCRMREATLNRLAADLAEAKYREHGGA